MPSFRLATIAALSIAAIAAGGCTSTQIADRVPAWAGGEPPDTPKRREVPLAYPNVFNEPAQRQTRPLSAQEQDKLKAELAAAGRRHAAQVRAIERERAASAADDTDSERVRQARVAASQYGSPADGKAR